MVLTLVNSAVIILLVYVHIDTGDPTFGHYSYDRSGGGGGEGGGGGHGGHDGGGEGGGGDQGCRVEVGQGSSVEVMRVLRKLQAAQVPFLLHLKRYWLKLAD